MVVRLLGAIGLAATGCGSGGAPCTTQRPCVYVQSAQTVKQAIDSLPSTGGVVYLAGGTWSSGYIDYLDVISKPNVTIQGSGMPSYNSTFTAMTGGTIIQGPLLASSGADYLTVRDLGIDAGSAYINAANSGVPTDGLAIFNQGQVVGAPQVESPLIENVSCLGYTPTAKVHCILVENVNHAYVHNVMTVMNTHGLAFKGTNSVIDGVFARGHRSDGLIIKNDIYAPAANDQVSNITIQSLFVPADTNGIVLQSIGGSLVNIDIVHVQEDNVFTGILTQGTSTSTTASNLSFSDINVNYDPGNVAGNNGCFDLTGYVQQIQISSLNCLNMGYGIKPVVPSSRFTDFTITNSTFTNIATNGIETYGTWTVLNTSFENISQNAIFNPFGVTTVSGDTFTNVGGSDMLSGGGSFAELTDTSNRTNQ
jgi:hypothetical protein